MQGSQMHTVMVYRDGLVWGWCMNARKQWGIESTYDRVTDKQLWLRSISKCTNVCQKIRHQVNAVAPVHFD